MPLKKFTKFLNEINKLNPINEDLLKFSSQEIYLLNQIDSTFGFC